MTGAVPDDPPLCCPPLSVMCGKTGRGCVVTGAVRVNGEQMALHKLQKVLGFVPQDDIVHVDLTVRSAGCMGGRW